MREPCTLCGVDPVAWDVTLTVPDAGPAHEQVCDVCAWWLRSEEDLRPRHFRRVAPRWVDEYEHQVVVGIDEWLLPRLVRYGRWPYDLNLRWWLYRWGLVMNSYRLDESEWVWDELSSRLIRAVRAGPARLLRWRARLARWLAREERGLLEAVPFGWTEDDWVEFVEKVIYLFQAENPIAVDAHLVWRFLRELRTFWW